MTLRLKLLLAQAPLALVVLLLGLASIGTVTTLARNSQRILKDNYRSVLASQRMKEALERLDSAAAFRVAGNPDKAAPMVQPNRERFESELRVQENNITEPGEAEATKDLRTRWTRYQADYQLYSAINDSIQLRADYFERLQPQFAAVKDAADKVLDLNQDAMVRKSDEAQKAAQSNNSLLIAATLAALGVGLLFSIWLTSRLLRPLSVLTQAVRSIAEGDLDARALVTGKDEIALLASEFNTMAARLRDYRQSSLGELLQTQQASQAAIDSLPDPVLMLANDGSVINVNLAAETLLGVRGGESSGDPLAATAPALRAELDRVRAHVVSGKGSLLPRGFEEAVRVELRGGDRFLLPRASPVYSEEGAVIGVGIVLQDVTRLMRFDELRNDLVATVAHELRTPLTSLRMAIHLVLEQLPGPLNAKQLDLLHAARQDCERLQDIVDDLLDVSRMRGGQIEVRPAPVGARHLIAASIEQLQAAADSAGVQLAAAVEDELVVDADEARVGLVLGNLIGNALRHSPRGGTVQLRAEPRGAAVRFEVRDQGPGVPREYRERVFEKFFRVPETKGEGIGLGLYISREIVLAHGGEMGVESEPGQGTVFWFTLRSATGQPASAALPG